jgi:hypothetical protein
MDLSCALETRGGLAIVTGRLRNDADARKRVRVENALDGPVLPPRRRGVPEPGWDADGYTCRLAPGSTRAFGYVCVATPSRTEQPARIDTVEPATGDPIDHPTVVARRTLGGHRPPRDCLARSGNDIGGTATPANYPPEKPDRGGSDAADRRRFDALPDRIADRLGRLERVEENTLESATRTVSEFGDLGSLRRELRRLDADVDRLRTLRDRCGTLIERHERLEVPTEALERLA